MTTKRKLLAAIATLTLVGSISAAATLTARAATPACGAGCISIFSKELGTPANPGPVEDILNGQAIVGQPVILKQASGSDTSEDTLPRTLGGGHVSDFYAAGMVSAEANSHYGSLRAVQIEYAPSGVRSGLCVALEETAYQNEGLTLQPCNAPGLTVWILDFPDSPSTAPNWFPIVNSSTTDFVRPFAMSLVPAEFKSAHQLLQIRVRHLQFLTDDKTLPDTQLWGGHFGPYN
jgi:hypothetical protein